MNEQLIVLDDSYLPQMAELYKKHLNWLLGMMTGAIQIN